MLWLTGFKRCFVWDQRGENVRQDWPGRGLETSLHCLGSVWGLDQGSVALLPLTSCSWWRCKQCSQQAREAANH